MSLIACENLSLGYEGKIVLRDVNFTIEDGDYLAVLGENGSGKSTLIKGLLGLKAPEDGEIIFGEGLKSTQIGYLPQQNDIQRDFPATVQEIIMSGFSNRLGWRPFYNRKEKQRAQELCNALGINRFVKHSFRELSGGQQQRVLLARALAASTKLLILDEPFSGLDPLITQELYWLIEQVRTSGISIIMVSHDLHASLFHANKVLHLGARQLFFGTTSEYRDSNIGRSFLGQSVKTQNDSAGEYPHCELCNVEVEGQSVCNLRTEVQDRAGDQNA